MRFPAMIIEDSGDKYLYHGTIKERIPSILTNGLIPINGNHTRSVYKQEIIPLVFLTDIDNLFRCVSAMGTHIYNSHGVATPDCFRKEAIYKFGAIVIVEKALEMIQYVPDDEMIEDDIIWSSHPQVETGNYFSEVPLPIIGAICGDDLIEFLISNGELNSE